MRYRFDPKLDITAYELAMIYSRIRVFGRVLQYATFPESPPDLPEGAARHFVACDDEEYELVDTVDIKPGGSE